MIIFKLNSMKKFKFTKTIKNKGLNFNKFNCGIWAIQTITYGLLSINQINYIKQYLQKSFKKYKHFKFNITLNKIITKKPLDTRMGGGKGSILDSQYVLKPGSIFLEFYNINSYAIIPIFRLINNKIPIKIRLISIN